MGNTIICGGCVDEGNIGVVEKYRRFQRLAHPGFHWLNPCLGERLAGVLPTRVTDLNVHIKSKTKNDVFVQLECSILYRVFKENVVDAFYELRYPRFQIKLYVSHVVEALVHNMTLDELFEQKNYVAKAAFNELHKVMESYGYNIEHVLITDILPTESVCNIMNEIITTQKKQLAQGEIENMLVVKKAEAEAEAKYIGSGGSTRRSHALNDGSRENTSNFPDQAEEITAKEFMDLLKMSEPFDTIKERGKPSNNTITSFIPHGPFHVE